MSREKTRSWQRIWIYIGLRYIARWIGIMCFDLRMEGRHHLPRQGGGLILSSHQSMLDPVFVGLIFNRRLNYLARKTLFRHPIFSRFIRFLDAIEIDREGGGLMGIRQTIERLKTGEMVLLFPEGTRTENGLLGPLKSGFLVVARRSKSPLIPIAIIGAFESMPRGAKLPLRRPISLVVAEPISAQMVSELQDDALLQLVSQRLHASFQRGKILTSAGLDCS